MDEFNEFVENLEVVDPRAVGRKFTWFSRDGGAMSRLDLFLVSEGLIVSWQICGQMIGSKDLSDHCPIWFKGSERN